MGAGVWIVQADPPGRAVRRHPSDPLPGLQSDLARGDQKFVQVIDRASQPAPSTTARSITLTALREPSGLRSSPAQRHVRVGQ